MTRAHPASCTQESAKSEHQEKRVVDPAPLVKREVADLFSQGARVNRADHLAENSRGLVADRHYHEPVARIR